jgi:hypothetical protein
LSIEIDKTAHVRLFEGVTRDRVMKRIAPVEAGAPKLWPFIQRLVEDCVAAGYLQDTPVANMNH